MSCIHIFFYECCFYFHFHFRLLFSIFLHNFLFNLSRSPSLTLLLFLSYLYIFNYFFFFLGNSPLRVGTQEFLDTCKNILGFESVFKKVIGSTVVGYRHSLIGSSSSSESSSSGGSSSSPLPIDTSILELQLL